MGDRQVEDEVARCRPRRPSSRRSPVADLSVGARSAAAAPFCLLQVLKVNQGEGRKLARCKADPDLTRQGSFVLVNRQDQVQSLGLFVLSWRFIPTDNSRLGKSAL